MDLINRYVYAVTKGLPEKQREDIDKELRVLIDDMIEQNPKQENYEEAVQDVLLKLGDPIALADNYRESKRYLIGPQNYDKYLLLLKVVLSIVIVVISIVVFIESIYNAEKDIQKIILSYITEIISGLTQTFVWITVAFAIYERYGNEATKGIFPKKEWTIQELPEIPDNKASIPLAEPIVSIFLATILVSFLISAPELIAIIIRNNSEIIKIPIFDAKVLKDYRLILIIIYSMCILQNAFMLYFRRWTLRLSVIVIIFGIISDVLALIVFANSKIWNPSFVYDMMKYRDIGFDLSKLWEHFKLGVIVAIILFSVVAIFTALYKGIKYSSKSSRGFN